MIELLAAFVHPLTLVLLLAGVVALEVWLEERRFRRWWRDNVRGDAPPPDTP